MAIKFGDTKGKAASNKVDSYEYKDGVNTVRLVGDVLARYVYWLKGTNNKDIPVECLAFDRNEERFANREVDHVPSFFPDKKCSWSYSINCIDPKDGTVKALNLKKKLFGQIMDAAGTLGDPTDPDDGWDIVFKKVKTGPLPFNVEYTLDPFKCKKRPLTEDERAAVDAAASIDSKFPRATPVDVLKTLEKMTSGGDSEDGDGDGADGSTDGEAVRDLG